MSLIYSVIDFFYDFSDIHYMEYFSTHKIPTCLLSVNSERRRHHRRDHWLHSRRFACSVSTHWRVPVRHTRLYPRHNRRDWFPFHCVGVSWPPWAPNNHQSQPNHRHHWYCPPRDQRDGCPHVHLHPSTDTTTCWRHIINHSTLLDSKLCSPHQLVPRHLRSRPWSRGRELKF